MDSEKIVEIFKNEDFRKKLSECKSSEEKVDLLGQNGIMISLDEYRRLEQIANEARTRSISEEELENVAGGLGKTAKNVLASIGVIGGSALAIWGVTKFLGKE